MLIFFLVLSSVLSVSTGFRFNQQLHYPRRYVGGLNAIQDNDVLVRALRGESTRPPVWLMRQAGRYIKEFRAYSEKYSFRERSETPEIAVELSLQPLRKFGVDGVIFFSGMSVPV